jgi:hypothetical protein
LRGFGAAGTAIELWAAGAGREPSAPLGAVFGSEDLVLSIFLKGSIAGRILHGGGRPPANLHLVAQRRGAPEPAQRDGPSASGSVFLDDLHPGLYDLSVIVRGFPEPLLSLPGIAVGEGERVVPPALDPFDARGILRAVRVRTEDESGKGFAATLHFRTAGRAEAAWESVPTDGSKLLFTTGPPLDLRAARAGYRSVEALGAMGEVTLTLEAATCRLRLRLRDPKLAESYLLGVTLQPPPEVGPEDAESLEGRFNDSGSSHLKLSEAGRYVAILAAVRPPSEEELEELEGLELRDFLEALELRSSVELRRFPIDVVESSEQQVVWIDLTSDEIERALRSQR